MSRVRGIALVLLLLLAAVAPGGPVGTAAAGHTCDTLDRFISGLTLTIVNHHCVQPHYDEGVQDMQESQADQTELDIYNVALGVQAQRETEYAVMSNYLQDSQPTAWMKVENATATAYTEGDTEAQATSQARGAVSKYYSKKQINLIESWNNTVNQLVVIDERGDNETNVGTSYVRLNESASFWNGDDYSTRTTTVTLANGSTHDVLELYANSGDYGSTWSLTINTGVSAQNWNADVDHYEINSPSSTSDPAIYVGSFQKFKDKWDEINNLNDNLQTESDNFVSATYPDFESGQINASDVISSHTAMFEYGVRSENSSEGLYQSTAALAMMGFDTPNMTNTGMMNVTYNGQTYTGMVLAQEAPSGKWVAGTTYNTSDISGPVFMATDSGGKIDFAKGEQFTITEMTARDGSDITEANTTKYIYKTSNTTELLEMQQSISQLRAQIEYEQQQSGGGGGGTTSDSGPLDDIPAEALIVAAVAAVLLLREG